MIIAEQIPMLLVRYRHNDQSCGPGAINRPHAIACWNWTYSASIADMRIQSRGLNHPHSMT